MSGGNNNDDNNNNTTTTTGFKKRKELLQMHDPQLYCNVSKKKKVFKHAAKVSA